MSIVSQVLPPAVIKAIGWTLLHSLWQGFAIALLLAILLLCLQKSSAAIRYFISTGAMLTFAIIAAITFTREYTEATIKSQREVATTPSGTKAMGMPIELSLAADLVSPLETWSLKKSFTSFQLYFGQHLPLIVLVWGIGITLLIIRFMGGYAYMQRLKNYKTVELPISWQQTLVSLAEAAKVTRKIKLVESALVKVPIVVGYVKPVILLPVGTIIGLPAEQVEAILAHELAHIYRKDYLVNIFQCMLEITFFYHPAIWWISSRIREEREHCCDDLALTICGNTVTFAKALASIGYVTQDTPALAMGFPGKSNLLLSRIKRLGTARGRKPNFMEGFLAACFVMLSASMISVSAGMNKDTAQFQLTTATLAGMETNQQLPSAKLASDTTKNTFTFKGIRNGKRYAIEAEMESGEITALTVNGKKIPQADFYQYQELIFDLMGAVPAPPAPAVASIAPHISPEPAADPHPAVSAVKPAISSSLLPGVNMEHPKAPFPALVPDDVRGMIRRAFAGDTSKKAKGDFVYLFTGKNNKTYKITLKDGVLTDIRENGKKIPKSEFSEYAYLADEVPGDGLNYESYNRSMQQYRESMAKYDEAMKQYNRLMQEYEKSGAKHADAQRRDLLEERVAELEEDRTKLLERQLKLLQASQEERQRNQEALMQRAMKQQEMAMKKHEQAMAKHEQSARLSKELINVLNTELAKDGLIQKDQTHYIQISPNGLFIDSKKQPDQVYQKYKALLEKKAGKDMDFTIQYHYNPDQLKVDSFIMEDQQMEKHRSAMEQHEDLIRSLNKHLIKENLVKKNKSYQIRISPEGLFINQEKQPEEIFNRFKKQIEEQTGESFVYTLEYDFKGDK